MWKRHQTPVWIQVLSGTYCASHRTIRFWEAMWHSVKILLCNYSTRYLSHSRQLLSILWIKWPESFSHILPLTSSHSHIDSTYHVILICYYSSYHAIWGPLGNCDCWALKHQQKKNTERFMLRTHLAKLSWSRACCQDRHVKGSALTKAEWKLFSVNAMVTAICCEKAHTLLSIWETLHVTGAPRNSDSRVSHVIMVFLV